ncbi:7982_t:CDS:1 [Racocetra fulgida]|uniref:7982_t:CDS:1 n=1 Tax=Racocetra fulgida TaxID=60492 RepID=A0A9N9C6Y3_9GLOM|nr:7982_t:CDS:1 [Racocetra fulgida]
MVGFRLLAIKTTDQSDSNPNRDLKSITIRLIELTQRTSMAMKFHDLPDTPQEMDIFSAFGQTIPMVVDSMPVVAALKNFCHENAENVNLVIIPWGGAGEIKDTQNENTKVHITRDKKNCCHENAISSISVMIPCCGVSEIKDSDTSNENVENHIADEKDFTSPQIAKLVQTIFNEIKIYASVGVFVDRGLSSAISATTFSDPTECLRVFVPFFGGADDREAITFALRLLEYPNVDVTVLRIKKSVNPTENNVMPKTQQIVDELNGCPSHVRSMSTINSNYAALQDSKDDELIWTNVRSKENRPHLCCTEINSFTPIQDAIKEAKNHCHERKYLVILGRNRYSTVNESHHSRYGNDTYQSLGYVAEAFLAGGIIPSLLVLEAKHVEQ